jgi:hypothetical protein
VTIACNAAPARFFRSGDGGVSFTTRWFALNALKAWFWFVTFVVWLIKGRPERTWRAVTEIDGRPVRRIIRVTSNDHEPSRFA